MMLKIEIKNFNFNFKKIKASNQNVDFWFQAKHVVKLN